MKEYGKIKPSLLIASMVAVVLAGGVFVSAIPILQQKVNAQSGCSGGPPCRMVYVPGVGWKGGGGEEVPPEEGGSDTGGLHTMIPALKSSSHSDDASKK